MLVMQEINGSNGVLYCLSFRNNVHEYCLFITQFTMLS